VFIEAFVAFATEQDAERCSLSVYEKKPIC
jgi:hypothetical protein